MTKLALPSGGWAVINDASSIRAKDRKRVLVSLDDVDGEMAIKVQAAEVVMALAVAEWSFDLPLPSEQLSSLGELEIPDYDALAAAAAPIEKAIFPDFAMKVADGALEEGSPT